jgi:hypothetical protein
VVRNKPDDITTHYSAAELSELLNAAESIVNREGGSAPTLTLVSRKAQNLVGKLSESGMSL